MTMSGKAGSGPSATVLALLLVLAGNSGEPLTAAELKVRVPQLVVGHISSALRRGLIEVRDEVEVTCAIKTKMVAYRKVSDALVPSEYADLPLNDLPDGIFTLTDIKGGWLKSATATALVRRGVLERLPERVERVRETVERKRRYGLTAKGWDVVTGASESDASRT